LRADRREVIYSGGHAGHGFVILCAGFPAPGSLVAGGADLVRLQPLQKLAATVQDALVRAEERVGRASEKVAADGADVDWAVRRVMHGIDEAPGASGRCRSGDAGHVVDRADGVRGVADSDDLRFLVDEAEQLV